MESSGVLSQVDKTIGCGRMKLKSGRRCLRRRPRSSLDQRAPRRPRGNHHRRSSVGPGNVSLAKHDARSRRSPSSGYYPGNRRRRSALSLDRLWIIHEGTVWEKELSETETGEPHQLSKIARGGPEWGPSVYADVIVRVVTLTGSQYLLRASHQLISGPV